MEDITPVIGGKVPRRWVRNPLHEKIRVRLSGPLHSVLFRGIPVIISFRMYAQNVPNDIRNINELSDVIYRKQWHKNEDIFRIFEKALTLLSAAKIDQEHHYNYELDLGKLANAYLAVNDFYKKEEPDLHKKAVEFLKKPTGNESFHLLRETGAAKRVYESPVFLRFKHPSCTLPELNVMAGEWFGKLIRNLHDSGVMLKPALKKALMDRFSSYEQILFMLSEHLFCNYLATDGRSMMLLKRSMEAAASAARDPSLKKKTYMLDLSILMPEKLKELKIDETKIEDIIECPNDSSVVQFLVKTGALRIRKLQ